MLRRMTGIVLLLVLLCWITHLVSARLHVPAVESTCFGSVSKGRLEHGVSLPVSGTNFAAYSTIGHGLGRTFVHTKVHEIVLAAYQTLERMAPTTRFVYGETGWAAGGRMRPHRTHQNGLSVDFMVPVRTKEGRSIPLPTSVFNRFGYGIEFDAFSTGHFFNSF